MNVSITAAEVRTKQRLMSVRESPQISLGLARLGSLWAFCCERQAFESAHSPWPLIFAHTLSYTFSLPPSLSLSPFACSSLSLILHLSFTPFVPLPLSPSFIFSLPFSLPSSLPHFLPLFLPPSFSPSSFSPSLSSSLPPSLIFSLPPSQSPMSKTWGRDRSK